MTEKVVVEKIDHIALACKNIDEASKIFTEFFGLRLEGIETMSEYKVKIGFIPIGDTRIELVQPTGSSGPVADFIKKRGEGVHHLCFKVGDIEEVLERLKKKGFRLIDERPRRGVEGKKIAFLHPSSTYGTLIELSEEVSGSVGEE